MKKVTELLAAVGGAIASFFVNMPPLVWILIAVMTIDFITGLITAAMGRSDKTENGYISSSTAFRGLLKKGLILLIVLLAALLDMAVSSGSGIEFSAVMGATCLWFIASEGLSILENAATMGIPIPKILMRLLEIMREKGDGPAENKKPEEKETEKDEEEHLKEEEQDE